MKNGKGEQYGQQRFKNLVHFERNTLALKVQLTSLIEPENTTQGMVVFALADTLNGAPYCNELTIVFDFSKDGICPFREYVGRII